jgi:hypothetical protein
VPCNAVSTSSLQTPAGEDSTTVTELAEARDAVERLIDRPARQERTQQQRADEARRRP